MVRANEAWALAGWSTSAKGVERKMPCGLRAGFESPECLSDDDGRPIAPARTSLWH